MTILDFGGQLANRKGTEALSGDFKLTNSEIEAIVRNLRTAVVSLSYECPYSKPADPLNVPFLSALIAPLFPCGTPQMAASV
jgi:hypothetical protein